MYVQTIERDLPAEVHSAFDWLTDYRGDDLALVDDAPDPRTIEATGPGRVRISNPRPGWGGKVVEVTDITFDPPAHWGGPGNLYYKGRLVGTYVVDYRLTPGPPGSHLRFQLTLRPVGWWGRFLLRLTWRKIVQEHEANYDDIVAGFREDLSRSPGAGTVRT